MVEQPTLEQVEAISHAIVLDLPVPEHNFPETEARLRVQIAEIIAAGQTPDW